MKKKLVFILIISFFGCAGLKAQQYVDSLLNTMSKARIYLQCSEIKGQLPLVATFDKDPMELFKTKNPDILKTSPDTIAFYWNEMIKKANTSYALNKILTSGTLLIGREVGKRWAVTSAMVIDSKICAFAKAFEFAIGKTVPVELKCDNKVSF
jgi:hypothetical protein